MRLSMLVILLANWILFPLLPIWGGWGIIVTAFIGLYKKEPSLADQFLRGREGFFYKFTSKRNSGLILFINWLYLLTAPIWGGLFLFFVILKEIDKQELKDVFINGDYMFWEV